MSVKVEGLARFREKVLKRLPDAAKDLITKANDRNADDFVELVRRVIPRGDPEHGHLASTLDKHAAPGSETGVAVSIGGPGAPYPLHLEGGHRAADGTHVPGKAYWNPSKAVLRKRARGRQARAMNQAVKSITGGAK